MALHEALRNGFSGNDSLSLHAAVLRQQICPGGMSEKALLNSRVSPGTLKGLFHEGHNLTPGLLHNMDMAPIPTYASVMKSPFAGLNHLTRPGYAAEPSTGMASSPSKHPDHVSKFYFGKEDLGKGHEWQQVATDFPKKGACDPPHRPSSDKAQAESGKNAKQSPHWNKHNYNPLLENVFEPFSHLSEDFNELQAMKEDGPSYHPEKEVSTQQNNVGTTGNP
ncbi:hypothetical protein L7F22_045934 [Adiantum nelumboides]|nr:hypothetical protein [Adiantum nelumboides]